MNVVSRKRDRNRRRPRLGRGVSMRYAIVQRLEGSRFGAYLSTLANSSQH